MRALIAAATLAALTSCTPDTQADIPALETQITTWAIDQGATNPTVDCPDTITWDTGSDFHCIVTDTTETYRVTVTMENDDGDVTWVAG